jgi:hypothetical protein
MVHLRLARISNLPTILSNVLAGAALAGVVLTGAGAELQIVASPLLFVMLAMALFYTAGMYLNDYCDYRIDSRERPERPLPSGVIKPVTVLAFASGYFAAGLLLLALVRVEALLCGLLLVGVIVVYDRWHKRNPLGHFVMALARALVYITTFVAFAGMNWYHLAHAAFLLFLYVSGLTYIARNENRADFRRYWPVCLLVLPVGYFAFRMPISYLPVSILFLAWCAWSLGFVYRRTGKDIGGGIARLVAGIALFDAMVLASCGLTWPVAGAIALFVLVRISQRYIAGN